MQAPVDCARWRPHPPLPSGPVPEAGLSFAAAARVATNAHPHAPLPARHQPFHCLQLSYHGSPRCVLRDVRCCASLGAFVQLAGVG